MKNKLCERVEEGKLHIYVNSDKFGVHYNLATSFDDESIAYAINLSDESKTEEGLDWFIGLIGRDTQNWFHNDIVIHWGVNTWTFYNRKNISDFTKEEIKYFDKDDYSYEEV